MYVVCKNILNHYPPKLELPEHSIKCVLLTKGVSFHQKEIIVNCRSEKVVSILVPQFRREHYYLPKFHNSTRLLNIQWILYNRFNIASFGIIFLL